MFPSFNMKAIAAGAIFAAAAMTAPADQVQEANTTSLLEISFPTNQSVATGVIAPLPTEANIVVNVSLPEAVAGAAAENGTDADPHGVYALSWDFDTSVYEHSTDVQMAKAADNESAAPAANPDAPLYPISSGGTVVKWVKSIWDWVTGRIYKKARLANEAAAKAKAEAAAKAKAEAAAKAKADAKAAENVSETWTMDDPDYNGDEGDEGDEGDKGDAVVTARRVRFFQA